MSALRTGWALAVLGAGGLIPGGCLQPECSTDDFTQAECRVIAENELARAGLAGGLEVRFQDPAVADSGTWDARGLVEVVDPDRVRARVAGPGRFAISIDHDGTVPTRLAFDLDNVDPTSYVVVTTPLDSWVVPRPDPAGLLRSFEIDVLPGTTWIRGETTCAPSYRLAVTGDIQTNPGHFARIVERLQDEATQAAAAGEPLMGLVLVGDLTESSRDDEFERIDALLRRAPVPVAVTPGNHDIYRRLRPSFNTRFGPGNHVSEVCDTRLVLLDSGSGAIARSVEGRLPELLDADTAAHLLVGMHHPPYPGATAAGWNREDRAQHLLVEAAIAGADLIVAGHSHALHHFGRIDVGDVELDEVIVGTGGAYQGIGVPRYGYLRVTLTPGGVQRCFVEVPPPGFDGVPNAPPADGPAYCAD